MCLSLYDYQSKESRYRKGLTGLKNRVTTNKKYKIDLQKTKEENICIIQKKLIKAQKKKRKRKKDREEIQNQQENKV